MFYIYIAWTQIKITLVESIKYEKVIFYDRETKKKKRNLMIYENECKIIYISSISTCNRMNRINSVLKISA